MSWHSSKVFKIMMFIAATMSTVCLHTFNLGLLVALIPPLVMICHVRKLEHSFRPLLQITNNASCVWSVWWWRPQINLACTTLWFEKWSNFELQSRVNFLTEKGRHDMWDYIKMTKPTVIVIAPLCPGFSPWSFLNEVIHPDAVAWRRAQGVPRANFCVPQLPSSNYITTAISFLNNLDRFLCFK